jgi:hypothetical protein
MAQMVVTAGSLMRSVLLPFILVALLVWNLPTVNFAIGNLLAMTARIQSLEASGVKLAFRDPKKIDFVLSAAGVDQGQIGQSTAALPKLTGAHIERLFTIYPEMISCLYSNPDLQMSVYLGLDMQLERWGLVTHKPAEEALAELQKAGDQDSKIGRPVRCHKVDLTPTGYDAKTVLLGLIRSNFDGTASSGI